MHFYGVCVDLFHFGLIACVTVDHSVVFRFSRLHLRLTWVLLGLYHPDICYCILGVSYSDLTDTKRSATLPWTRLLWRFPLLHGEKRKGEHNLPVLKVRIFFPLNLGLGKLYIQNTPHYTFQPVAPITNLDEICTPPFWVLLTSANLRAETHDGPLCIVARCRRCHSNLTWGATAKRAHASTAPQGRIEDRLLIGVREFGSMHEEIHLASEA